MPQLIQHIDAIARKKSRDVLFLTFGDHVKAEEDEIAQPGFSRREEMSIRNSTIAWLDVQGIEWEPCGAVANPNGMSAYPGWIYLDVPYDDNDATYCALRDYLEKPDGSMAHPGVTFCYYPLEAAMLNTHHDAPGFWEEWAENF